MGDRGNIYIKDADSGIYLYTHWAGTELPVTVRNALARQQRWDDGPYLARILFDTLTEGETGSESGYGISSVIGDNGHLIVVVDVDAQTVTFAPQGQEKAHTLQSAMSFTEYVGTAVDALQKKFES
jgi:hypothetical protein